MKRIQGWIAPICSLAVAIMLWLLLQHQKEFEKTNAEYWEKRNFITDTLKVDYTYTLPADRPGRPIPPAQVVEYRPPNVDHIRVVLNDSLMQVIDSLQNTITVINERYFKLFPKASKLIYGQFTRDSIQFDLLDIAGDVRTLKYGANFDRFSYQYRDGQLKASPVKSVNRKFISSFYGYGGYDLGLRAPVLGADYAVYKNKFRLKANTFITAEKQPSYSLQLNLGYSIK